MKRWIGVALLAGATLAHAQPTPASPAKKELVAKLISLQTPAIESVARSIVERPAVQLMQAAGQMLQTQIAPDKREALGRSVEADVKKFVEESTPVVKERAVKLAPSTIGPTLEEKFSEDELKQLIAWFESPVNKKYQQLGPEMQANFSQKLIAEISPLLDPKLKALQEKVRGTLTSAVSAPGSAAASGKPAAAPKAARPASK
jgi:hypothetical protein